MTAEERPLRLCCTVSAHRGPVSAVRFSNSGRIMATSSADSTVALHRMQLDNSQEPVVYLTRLAGDHFEGVNDCAFHPSDNWMATASNDRTVRVWDVARHTVREKMSRTAPFRVGVCAGHVAWVMSVTWSERGSEILSAGFDETARIYDARSCLCVGTLRSHTDPVSAACYVVGTTIVATGSFDGLVRLWDTRTFHVLHTLLPSRCAPPVASIAVSPNGRYILSAGLDSTLRLWDNETAECVRTYAGGHRAEDMPVSCGFGALGVGPAAQDTVYVGSDGAAACVYGLNARRSFFTLPHGALPATHRVLNGGHVAQDNSVCTVGFCPALGMYATAALDCRVRLWTQTPVGA